MSVIISLLGSPICSELQWNFIQKFEFLSKAQGTISKLMQRITAAALALVRGY
jgi:hypothetical protein